jgi:HK97 family phage prohead protease
VNDIERKRLAKPFKVTAAEDKARTFQGHGSVFDDPHPTSSWRLSSDYQDIVRPGAFKKALAEHKKAGTVPAMFFNHDWDHVVGCYTSVSEDGDGLAVEGKIASSARQPTGEDLYELVSMGALNGLSIGFTATKFKVDEKAKTRELLEVTLPEVSFATIPGQNSARITDVKNARPDQLKRLIEEALREAGLSRSEAKAFIADGFKGFFSLRDAEDEGLKAAEQIAAMVRGVLPTAL